MSENLHITDVYNIQYHDGYYGIVLIEQLKDFTEFSKKDDLHLWVDKRDFSFLVLEDCMWDTKDKVLGYSVVFIGRWAAGCGGVHITKEDNCFDADDLKQAIDLIDEYEKSNDKYIL